MKEVMKVKKARKVITLIALITAIIVAFAGCGKSSETTTSANGTARTLDEIKESGKIVIGVFSDKKTIWLCR